MDSFVRCLAEHYRERQDKIHSPFIIHDTHVCLFFICVSDVRMCSGMLTLVGLTSGQRLTLGCLSKSFSDQGPPEATANELKVLVTGQ